MSCFDHRETRRPALRGAASISFRELVSGLDDVDATTVRLLRLDQKLMVPMNPRRMANLLNVTPELLREFLAHLCGIVWGSPTITPILAIQNRGRYRLRRCGPRTT